MTRKTQELKVLMSIGGPSVGKGLLGARLEGKYGATLFKITVGDLVRQRRKNDEAFNAEFGPLVDAGELLDDDIINPMVEAEFYRGLGLQHNFLYLDGWHRKAGQVEKAVELGCMMSENTICLDLIASREIQRTRNLDRMKRQPGGFRADDANTAIFEHRCKLFDDHHDEVVNAIQFAGVRIVNIDANQSLDLMVEEAMIQAQRLKSFGSPPGWQFTPPAGYNPQPAGHGVYGASPALIRLTKSA